MKWTRDRLDWLLKSKEMYDDREDILKAFNEHFNLNVSLSLLTKNNGRYKLGLPKAWRLLRKNAEITQVKRRGFWKRPDDYEQTYLKENVVYIRTNDTLKHSKRKDGFVPKNRYLYEQYHDVKLDDIDDVIIFLDDDHTNFNKDNLYRLPRKTHALYLNHRLHKVKSVDKLTLIKYCEWKEKIFNLKGKIETRGGTEMISKEALEQSKIRKTPLEALEHLVDRCAYAFEQHEDVKVVRQSLAELEELKSKIRCLAGNHILSKIEEVFGKNNSLVNKIEELQKLVGDKDE